MTHNLTTITGQYWFIDIDPGASSTVLREQLHQLPGTRTDSSVNTAARAGPNCLRSNYYLCTQSCRPSPGGLQNNEHPHGCHDKCSSSPHGESAALIPRLLMAAKWSKLGANSGGEGRAGAAAGTRLSQTWRPTSPALISSQ